MFQLAPREYGSRVPARAVRPLFAFVLSIGADHFALAYYIGRELKDEDRVPEHAVHLRRGHVAATSLLAGGRGLSLFILVILDVGAGITLDGNHVMLVCWCDNEWGYWILIYVVGVNRTEYQTTDTVVANASCTAHGLTPLTKVAHEKFASSRPPLAPPRRSRSTCRRCTASCPAWPSACPPRACPSST
jgi:hypothetical protein